MKTKKPKRFHDDEALLHYLRHDRSDKAWQSFYRFYRDPVYQYFREQEVPEQQIKSILIKASAEFLDDIRSRVIKPPLSFSLLDILLARCIQVTGSERSGEKTSLPAGYTYLAKKLLVSHLQQHDRERVSDAIYLTFKEPAIKVIRTRYQVEETKLEDVFQDAIIALLKNPPQDKGETEAKLFTFFMRILRNKTVDLLHAKAKRDFPAGDQEDFERLLDDLVADFGHKNSDYWDYIHKVYPEIDQSGAKNSRDLIDKLLAKLSDKCRKLLSLRYLEEKKYKEIEAITGYGIDSIGQRIKRCLKKMRSEL